MTIDRKDHLQTIISEAGRQGDYYERSGRNDLANLWSEIEGLAFGAKQRGHSLIIETREIVSYPIPIKACEQHEQLHNQPNTKPL